MNVGCTSRNLRWCQSEYAIDGTARLDKAAIVFVTVNPGKPSDHIRLINEIGCDLLLVEVTPYGCTIQSFDNKLTKGLDEGIKIRGFDLPDYQWKLFKFMNKEAEINIISQGIHNDLKKDKWDFFKNHSLELLVADEPKLNIAAEKAAMRHLREQGLTPISFQRLVQVIIEVSFFFSLVLLCFHITRFCIH
jgi:hypothetical protein